VLNFPVVVLVEEPEDLSEILRLLLALEVDVVENVILSPFDFVVIVQIEGLQKFLLNFFSVEVLQMFRVGSSVNVSFAPLNHSHN